MRRSTLLLHLRAVVAAALLSTLEDADLRQALVGAGADVAARFTWEESAQQHLAIYDEVCRSRRTVRAMSG